MFLSRRFIQFLVACIFLIALGKLWPIFYTIGAIALLVLLVAVVTDLFSVYSKDADIECERIMSQRFSNGDPNTIILKIKSSYKRPVKVTIIDEIPVEFQNRNFSLQTILKKDKSEEVKYQLTPKRRGEYLFEKINIYVLSRWGLVERQFKIDTTMSVKVYPSFSFIRNMELLSIHNKNKECGIKQVRRIGNSMEFDQIKEYVIGDDFRTINWKASARKHELMCNVYMDEQSQQIYNVIDKGRGMQHTFDKMSLLDYAINASLALSYMTMQHSDNTGLITFEKQIDSFVPASRKANQLEILIENLYKEKTSYLQSDFSCLYEWVRLKVNKRSLFVIYTMFDTNISMERQLPYLRKLATNHVVLVVFFKDKELAELSAKKPSSEQEYFDHVVAENIEFEKKMIVKNLRRYGIQSILTQPENLTVDVINKYLSLKAQRVI